ncbi:MAG: HU family DNA-binding protein [Alphaproteobacteria bacterium]|nr:HU family DNA-binding protein [Alphaproteobacteria bacterium]
MTRPMKDPDRLSRPMTGQTVLVRAVAEATGLPHAHAAAVVRTMLGEIAARLADGERVVFRGFGTFLVADRPERPFIDPRTGERGTSPARRAVRFVPSALLKRSVNAEAEA